MTLPLLPWTFPLEFHPLSSSSPSVLPYEKLKFKFLCYGLVKRHQFYIYPETYVND